MKRRDQPQPPRHPSRRPPLGRSRLRTLLKWSGTLACLLIVGQTGGLMGVTTSAGRQWVVGLNKGALEGSWWFGSGWNHCTAPGAHLGVGRERFNLRKWLDGFSSAGWPRAEINQRGVGVRLPLWIPFLLIGLPTGWLWWRDRRRVPAGCCACGYDLTGNISGRCPECGALREVGTPEEVGRPKSEV